MAANSWLDLPLVRLATLAGAGVIALMSRGDFFVLAVLLAVGAGRYATGVACGAVAASVVLRWGSSSLGALAGGQAVLGLAGTTGDATHVASSWCGAVALVLSPTLVGPPIGVRPLPVAVSVVSALPFGLAAAAVVAGPGPGGNLPIRVLAAAVGVVAAAIVARRRENPREDRTAATVAVLAGVSSVVLAAAT